MPSHRSSPARERVTTGGVLRFLLILAGLLTILFFTFPVFFHGLVFSYLVRNFAYVFWIVILGAVFIPMAVHYLRRGAPTIGFALIVADVVLMVGGMGILAGIEQAKIAQMAKYELMDQLPAVSREHVRYTPLQVAEQEISRRTQSSQRAIEEVIPLSGPKGPMYIAPLIVNGVVNMYLGQNQGFEVFDDAGTVDNGLDRVSLIDTPEFQVGDEMEIFDNLDRRLILDVGFFNTYPRTYYAPIYKEDGVTVDEVVGIVPYISYTFWWGFLLPEWGGVAVFHADGTIENLTPAEAQQSEKLAHVDRLFPSWLAEKWVYAQPFDQGWLSGYIRRDDKIEVPRLEDQNQMPFYLLMEDGTSQYITMTEPDGPSFALRKIYYTDARTGTSRVYAYNDKENILGPAKAVSMAKSVTGYTWYEDHGQGGSSGSYRIIEPRPVTRGGELYYMYSIVPKDYGTVVATVFVNAATSKTIGPFTSRDDAFAWLLERPNASAVNTAVAATIEGNAGTTTQSAASTCEQFIAVCEQIEQICPSTSNTAAVTPAPEPTPTSP